jgi:hypothetical protein
MPTLLQIDSSPLPSSVSRELTREYAQAWTAAHPDGRVLYRDLAHGAPPPAIDAEWIGAAYTPEGQLTEAQAAKLAISNELIAELEAADEYVIGAQLQRSWRFEAVGGSGGAARTDVLVHRERSERSAAGQEGDGGGGERGRLCSGISGRFHELRGTVPADDPVVLRRHGCEVCRCGWNREADVSDCGPAGVSETRD